MPVALRAAVKGGTAVCGGIHMSEIPSFPHALLWGERRLVSVANLTRGDRVVFIEVTRYPLADANRALDDLRNGTLSGAAVLMMRQSNKMSRVA